MAPRHGRPAEAASIHPTTPRTRATSPEVNAPFAQTDRRWPTRLSRAPSFGAYAMAASTWV
eukprot:10841652-Lingulodinium_polyedra.AAC.1